MSRARLWWTPEDLAASGLPGIPGNKRGVNRLADRSGWRDDPALFRRQGGRGGGWEYHRDALPAEARAALAGQENVPSVRPKPAAEPVGRDAAWAAFEAAPESARAEAQRRLDALQAAEALSLAGTSPSAAADLAAERAGVSVRTLYNWMAAAEGARADDRLAFLLPKTALRGPSTARAAVDPAFGDLVKADYLRPSRPSLKSSYDRALRIAAADGVPAAGYKAIQRWIAREVSRPSLILAREGVERLKQLYPPQVRDKSALHAMEAVNGDVHRFDVFVRWPALPGEAEGAIARPQMVAFQDLHSGRLLAWRVDRTPNAQAVKLAVGDMIDTFGIPERVVLDNGREFAAKELTAGAPTRYRFKVREDDVPGLFVQLGCTIHWATPYSGQSKPIERAFRDLCDRVSKDPRFEGAYTGNRPDAKPENYGSRAIPLAEFLDVLAEGIEDHNTRRGRRSEVAWGRSFAEVFDESYAEAPIRKATAEQRRLWLMGAENLRGHSKTGEIALMGNRYWANWLTSHAGARLVARFDPAALWDGIHVYDAAGRYLGEAPCREKAGFFDVDEARTHSKARREWIAAEKRALEALRRKTAAELGAALDAVAPETGEPAQAKVVAPMFAAPRRAREVEADAPEIAERQSAIVADLAARRVAAESLEEADEERTRFRRALDLIRDEEGGDALTREQARWLTVYRESSEFRAQMRLFENFGEAMFAGM